MARPTKLDNDVQAAICAKLGACCTYKDAALAAGISYETFNNWRKRGEAEVERVDSSADRRVKIRKDEAPFVQFLQATTRAEAIGRVSAAEAIHSNILGAKTVETSEELIEETARDKAGNVVFGKDGQPITLIRKRVSRRTVNHPPDGDLALKYLARRDAENWTTKAGDGVSVSINLYDIYERTADEFDRLFGDLVAAGEAAQMVGQPERPAEGGAPV